MTEIRVSKRSKGQYGTGWQRENCEAVTELKHREGTGRRGHKFDIVAELSDRSQNWENVAELNNSDRTKRQWRTKRQSRTKRQWQN